MWECTGPVTVFSPFVCVFLSFYSEWRGSESYRVCFVRVLGYFHTSLPVFMFCFYFLSVFILYLLENETV
jgi:ABC-type dipeptide/oligopeptide/nickel transport system permease component